jgi:hypothetical protein
MTPHPILVSSSKPTPAQAREAALNAAKMLRDCSFRRQSTVEDQQSCRTLMREHALQWRNPECTSSSSNRAPA